MRWMWLLVFVFPLSGASAPADAQRATELRIATVAPEGSPWMRVFRAWDAELRQRTNGQLGLRLYPGAPQG